MALYEDLLDRAADNDKQGFDAELSGSTREETMEAVKSYMFDDLASYSRHELVEQLVEAWMDGSRAMSEYTDEELKEYLRESMLD